MEQQGPRNSTVPPVSKDIMISASPEFILTKFRGTAVLQARRAISTALSTSAGLMEGVYLETLDKGKADMCALVTAPKQTGGGTARAAHRPQARVSMAQLLFFFNPGSVVLALLCNIPDCLLSNRTLQRDLESRDSQPWTFEWLVLIVIYLRVCFLNSLSKAREISPGLGSGL